MIHLFSNIYLTYWETKPIENADVIIVGLQGRKKEVLLSENTKRIARYYTLDEMLASGSFSYFDSLHNRISAGTSHKISVHMDKACFKEFMVKWLKTVYAKASVDNLFKIYMFYRSCEVTKMDRIRLTNDDLTAEYKADTLLADYWNLTKEDFTTMANAAITFDMGAGVYDNIGFEHLVANSILGDSTSQTMLKAKLPELYLKAIQAEAMKTRMVYTVWSMSYLDPSKVSLDADFYDDILAAYPLYTELNKPLVELGGIAISTLASHACKAIEGTDLSLPICQAIKAKGTVHTVDEMYADVVGADTLQIIRPYTEKARYNPYLPALAKSTMEPELISFRPF